jgi:membrane protein
LRATPPQRWLDVAIQTARDLWTSNVLEWAAALACYAVLSLFPLLVLGLVAASFVVDVTWATDQAIDLLAQYLPDGERTIETILGDALAQRGRVGVVSGILLIVTGRRILGGLTKGLNLVSDVDVHDDTVKRRVAVELGLTVGLAILVLLAFATRRLGEVGDAIVHRVPGPDGVQLAVLRGTVHVILLLVMFTLVYAGVPRGERTWRAVFLGAIVATSLFLLAQGVFAVVFDRVWNTMTLVYGPIAFAVLLLTWCWYVAIVTLTGGAVASHVKVMILERRSTREAHARHVQTVS